MAPPARPYFIAALGLGLGACFDPAPDSNVPAGETSDTTTTDVSTSTGEPPTSSGEDPTDAAESSTGDPEGSTTGLEETGDSSSGSSSTSAAPACGDGNVDEGEGCDDGNDSDLDGCSVDCTPQYHSGNDDLCPADATGFCAAFGAQCRLAFDGRDGLCYWANAADEDQCNATPGIWTPTDGEYASDHPEASFPDPGACITELFNLRCPVENATACSASGGDLCFRALDPTGLETTGPDLCWWDTNPGGCAATPGIWTEPGDGFHLDHPNALPAGMAACVTQVPNL